MRTDTGTFIFFAPRYLPLQTLGEKSTDRRPTRRGHYAGLAKEFGVDLQGDVGLHGSTDLSVARIYVLLPFQVDWSSNSSNHNAELGRI